jgi:hypothetical protein
MSGAPGFFHSNTTRHSINHVQDCTGPEDDCVVQRGQDRTNPVTDGTYLGQSYRAASTRSGWMEIDSHQTEDFADLAG